MLVNECRCLQGNTSKSRKFSVSKMIGTLIGNSNSKNGNIGSQTQQQTQGGTVVVCQKSDLHRSRVLKRRQNFTATASLWLDQGPAGPSDAATRCATVVPWDAVLVWFPWLVADVRVCKRGGTRTWPFHTSGSLWRPRRDGCCHYFKLSRHSNSHRSGKAMVKVRRRWWIQVGTVLLLKNAGDIINKTWHDILSSNAPIPKPGVTVKLMNKKRISVWRIASLRHIKPQTR